MTNSPQNTGPEPTPETSFILDISQELYSIQHNVRMTSQLRYKPLESNKIERCT
jgi:hypothetical protein